MTTVERIKRMCKTRKISLAQLERDCGFSNGYLAGLKRGNVPDNRLYTVSEYLNTTPEYLTTGKEPEDDILFLAKLRKTDPELFKKAVSLLKLAYKEIHKEELFYDD